MIKPRHCQTSGDAGSSSPPQEKGTPGATSRSPPPRTSRAAALLRTRAIQGGAGLSACIQVRFAARCRGDANARDGICWRRGNPGAGRSGAHGGGFRPPHSPPILLWRGLSGGERWAVEAGSRAARSRVVLRGGSGSREARRRAEIAGFLSGLQGGDHFGDERRACSSPAHPRRRPCGVVTPRLEPPGPISTPPSNPVMISRATGAGSARPSARRPRRRRASKGLIEAYLDGVRRFATFTGRSNRTQFFTFLLTNFAISNGIVALEVAAGARAGGDHARPGVPARGPRAHPGRLGPAVARPGPHGLVVAPPAHVLDGPRAPRHGVLPR